MVNKVILVGNVGMEPEVRALETGVKVARLRIATTERIYNSATGEKREHTEWHTVVVWRGQADFAEKYIHKGSQVYVEGKIRSREWTEEATGTKRYAIEVLSEEIRLLGGRASAGGSGAVAGTGAATGATAGTGTGSTTGSGFGAGAGAGMPVRKQPTSALEAGSGSGDLKVSGGLDTSEVGDAPVEAVTPDDLPF